VKSDFIVDRTDSTDIIPMYVGHEECKSAHSFGPHIRDNFLIHYCLFGHGTLFDKFGEHKISAGEMFIIRPNEITTYVADSENPWTYVWIGFKGTRAALFDTDKSVYSCPSEPFLRLRELVYASELSAYAYMSVLYDIIYRTFGENGHESDTLSQIRKYIRYNYMMDITAESVAKSFGYERTYLYRIFKRKYGIGVKEYIINIRMDNAKRFLLEGRSVGETAALTGYKDEFNFSRAYKKHFGIPPSHTKRCAE
jgi:AraC-like DNA-binding protein